LASGFKVRMALAKSDGAMCRLAMLDAAGAGVSVVGSL
jgi:hypothetical protein